VAIMELKTRAARSDCLAAARAFFVLRSRLLCANAVMGISRTSRIINRFVNRCIFLLLSSTPISDAGLVEACQKPARKAGSPREQLAWGAKQGLARQSCPPHGRASDTFISWPSTLPTCAERS